MNRYMRRVMTNATRTAWRAATRIDAMMSELDWLNMNLSNNPSIQFRLKNIISSAVMAYLPIRLR